MMKVFQEFKKFAVQGNVIDMAVGVVIGTAFGKIVSSLVTDIIMPPIGMLTGGIDFSHFSITLKEASEQTPAIEINYGLFINTVLDFVIIAFAIFLLVKQVNNLRERVAKKEEQAAQETAATQSAKEEEIQLLREIRDALKSSKS